MIHIEENLVHFVTVTRSYRLAHIFQIYNGAWTHQTKQKLKLNAFGRFARRCRVSKKKGQSPEPRQQSLIALVVTDYFFIDSAAGVTIGQQRNKKQKERKYKGQGIKTRNEERISEVVQGEGMDQFFVLLESFRLLESLRKL